MRAALIAGFVAIAFAMGEFLALMLLSFSSIVMADTIHSILDALMSFVTAFSIYIAVRGRRSPRFPWGLYKAESLVAMFIAVITLLFMLETVYSGVTHPSKTPHYAIPLFILGFAASYTMYRYEARWAESSMSSSLKADALHARSDALLTLAALAGVSIETITSSIAPQIAVLLLIAGYIVRDAYHILRESILSLLDAMPPRDKVLELASLAEKYSGLRVSRIMLKRAGSFITGVIVLEADPGLTLGEIQRIVGTTRRMIYREKPEVVNLIIAVKPRKAESLEEVASIARSRGGVYVVRR